MAYHLTKMLWHFVAQIVNSTLCEKFGLHTCFVDSELVTSCAPPSVYRLPHWWLFWVEIFVSTKRAVCQYLTCVRRLRNTVSISLVSLVKAIRNCFVQVLAFPDMIIS